MDFVNMDISGRIASEAVITERDNIRIASFCLDFYQRHTGNVQIQIVVNSQSLIEKAVKPYIIRQNIGRRIVIIGQPFMGVESDRKSILISVVATRFCFIDKLVSEEQAQYAVDFSED